MPDPTDPTDHGDPTDTSGSAGAAATLVENHLLLPTPITILAQAEVERVWKRG